jgi:hypothetical protein
MRVQKWELNGAKGSITYIIEILLLQFAFISSICLLKKHHTITLFLRS